MLDLFADPVALCSVQTDIESVSGDEMCLTGLLLTQASQLNEWLTR